MHSTVCVFVSVEVPIHHAVVRVQKPSHLAVSGGVESGEWGGVFWEVDNDDQNNAVLMMEIVFDVIAVVGHMFRSRKVMSIPGYAWP